MNDHDEPIGRRASMSCGKKKAPAVCSMTDAAASLSFSELSPSRVAVARDGAFQQILSAAFSSSHPRANLKADLRCWQRVQMLNASWRSVVRKTMANLPPREGLAIAGRHRIAAWPPCTGLVA